MPPPVSNANRLTVFKLKAIIPIGRKDARELYYLGLDGQVYAVPIAFRLAAVHAGKPEALFTIDAEARSTLHSVVSFDVSADGSRFVIPSVTPGESSTLVVLQDWESQVAKPN